ncbi:uncharacterized protein [Ptychodera flava]
MDRCLQRQNNLQPAVNGLEVIFRLADDLYHQYRQSPSHYDEVRTRRLDAAWLAYRSSFEDEIDALLPDEGRRQQVRQVIEDKCGCVDVLSMEKGSLAVTLHVPRLINLYRLERTTKSGSLAEAMEPVLITDKAKAMAERAGIPGNLMKLHVIYDQGTFQAIQQFLIKRDGGVANQTLFSEDEIEEVSDEEIQYEPEIEETNNTSTMGVGQKLQCEECRILQDIYQREYESYTDREKALAAKLLRQYLKSSSWQETGMQCIPLEEITDDSGEAKGENIAIQFKEDIPDNGQTDSLHLPSRSKPLKVPTLRLLKESNESTSTMHTPPDRCQAWTT